MYVFVEPLSKKVVVADTEGQYCAKSAGPVLRHI